MKTLKDIAGLYRGLATQNLQSGPLKAFKTGNLYRNVSQYNTLDKMIRTRKGAKKGDTSYDLVLQVAPPDAKYGKFIEKGTKNKDGSVKMKARPFGEAAANSKELARAVDLFMKGQVEASLEVFEEQITKKFVKAGFTVS